MDLIPIPYSFEKKTGRFIFPDELKAYSEFDLPLLTLERSREGLLRIKKDESIAPEGYTLEVAEKLITVTASTQTGAYYALQSLRQLSRYELGKRTIDCVKITDKPRFSWRGMQLDESRHFWGKDFVKQLLDRMFMMKLNVFHWHLTDDQGWRIEIKKYPLLTEIGSRRKYTHLNGWGSKQILNEEYGGYYTQEDIREIVDYAAQRGITVVPEVDFPAHAAAVLAAYPHLACRELKRDVPGYFGEIIPEKVMNMKDWNRTVCAGKETTYKFIFDVLDEICRLFPSKYIHIGGDEAPKDEWKKCPHCQKVIKENNLKNEEDLHAFFNNKILSHLKKNGKSMIGWNEILKAGNLDKTVVAQYWTPQRDRNAEKYVNSGGNVILSNHQSFYFDMPYAQYGLKNTYTYKPEKYGVNKDNVKNVLGVEAESWTEWIDSTERYEMMVYPRMQALAEAAWSEDSNKGWKDFLSRLDRFKEFYEYLGINWAVDKISMPKSIASRIKIMAKFRCGDTALETKLNKEYKLKGER